MLDYLISLMDDAHDFSWDAAMASHAVLLCRMEQGEVKSYLETDKLDRIRRANAQRHVSSPVDSKNSQKDQKIQKYSTAHISIREHVFTLEPTKPRVSLIVMSALTVSNKILNCFHIQSMTVEISQNVFQKTNEGGWDFSCSHPKISYSLYLQ